MKRLALAEVSAPLIHGKPSKANGFTLPVLPTRDWLKLFASRGCQFVVDNGGNITIVVPHGALGIKALGYLDLLAKKGDMAYRFDSDLRCPPPPPRPLSRRVSRVRVSVDA